MSWRTIHDNVGRSESLAALTDRAERLYWRLLAHSDAHGRLRANPAKLRAACYPLIPWTDHDVADALDELEAVGRVTLYQTPDGLALELTDFDANQSSDLKRKRGEPKIPPPPPRASKGSEGQASSALGQTRAVITNATYRKTPANNHKGSPRADHDGPRAAHRREEKNKQDQQQNARDELSGAAARARDPEPVDADLQHETGTSGDELGALLDALGATGGLARAARADAVAGRAVACARVALERDAVTNRAGYFRALLEAGTWPQTVTATRGANVLPADPVAALERMIRNGAIGTAVDLEAELRALDVDELAAARLRSLLPADSGRETRDPSADAASGGEEQGQPAPGRHAADLERLEPSAGDLEPPSEDEAA